MNLLLLIIPITAFGFPLLEHNDEILVHTMNNESDLGKMSVETRERLRKEWGGVDAEVRKTRLQRILQRHRGHEQNETQLAPFRAQLEQLVPVKLSKMDDDIFKMNEKAGIAEYLFEGDLDLSEEQLQMLEIQMETNDTHRSKRQAYSFITKWTNNRVNYFFDPTFNDETKTNYVRDTLQYISSHTCIDFMESSAASNRVRVINSVGCQSKIGMRGGEQTLYLADWCLSLGTIGHEFGHTLGLLHEHSRSDRDEYVTVNINNAQEMYQDQFEKMLPDDNLLLAPYEYGGFMQYGANFFAKDEKQFTILPWDMKYLHTMANKQITFYDFAVINKLYNCDAKCPKARSAKCANGGTPNPRNCAICNCPQGYGGDLCDQRPPGCGEPLNAKATWQRAQFVMGDKANPNVLAIPTVCTSWITAPPGKQVEVSILQMDNVQCNYGCQFNGFEVKAEDKRSTNPRYCCQEFNNRPVRSILNPTPVIGYNRYTGISVLYEYRFVEPGTPDLTEFLVPLKRFYKASGNYHRFHTNYDINDFFLATGMVSEGGIGAVLSPSRYLQNKAEIDAKCGSLKLIYAFYNNYEVMTPDAGFAQMLRASGWSELPNVGCCSSTPSCGASRPLRSVSALDGSTSVYSTDPNEIEVLNTWPQFKGTASPVICYLF